MKGEKEKSERVREGKDKISSRAVGAKIITNSYGANVFFFFFFTVIASFTNSILHKMIAIYKSV